MASALAAAEVRRVPRRQRRECRDGVRRGGVPRSIFLGDLSAPPQRMLQRSARLTPYAVVKVAHHGSADQEPGLYEMIQPRVALFSVGADNDYGHPRSETLDLLAATGAHVLRTDEQDASCSASGTASYRSGRSRWGGDSPSHVGHRR